jgi:hypothetical protein
MTSPSARPQSRSELLARARAEARMSRGREHFVRHDRLLPIGVPLATGLAAVAYGRQRGAGRGHRRALGAAAVVLAGTLALGWIGARAEWELHHSAYRRRRGF